MFLPKIYKNSNIKIDKRILDHLHEMDEILDSRASDEYWNSLDHYVTSV